MKDKIIQAITENSTEEYNPAYGNGVFVSTDALENIAESIVKLLSLSDVSTRCFQMLGLLYGKNR